MKLFRKMKLPSQIASGVLMVVIAVTAPMFIPLLHLEWWQAGILIGASWSLSWFGSVRATKGWLMLRSVMFAIEQEMAVEELDKRYQRKESHEPN